MTLKMFPPIYWSLRKCYCSNICNQRKTFLSIFIVINQEVCCSCLFATKASSLIYSQTRAQKCQALLATSNAVDWVERGKKPDKK